MRQVLRSRHVLACAALLVIVAAGLPAPASAQRRLDLSHVRVMAIAPFADDVSLSRGIADYGAGRLSELVAGRGYQVIPAARVAQEMRRLGIGTRELISPTKTWTIGQALGADVMVTGRVIHFMHDRDDTGDDGRSFGVGLTRVDVDIRVLDVHSRVNLFQNTFICQRPWPTYAAMECVVREVAFTFAGRP
jgi:hypothetical protein